tara:strand:+ start:15264 stop:16034 length:771 start_codon:yes stop_codon:yes gene_type:complete
VAVVKSSTAQLEEFILMRRVRLEREDVKTRSPIMIKVPNDMVAGAIFETNNFGNVEVIEYKSCAEVLIRFINTGYVYSVECGNLRIGRARDVMSPSVFGVGFAGGTRFSKTKGLRGLERKCYNTWQSMLERCYDKKCQEKNPTYKGCSVVDEWHNFQNFSEWFYDNYPMDGILYHLDKDIKINGNKVYSPIACSFVTQADNNIKAKAKNYKLIDPSGNIVEVYNLAQFCRDNDIVRECIRDMINGRQYSHRGWTRA